MVSPFEKNLIRNLQETSRKEEKLSLENESHVKIQKIDSEVEKEGGTLPELIDAVRANWLENLPGDERDLLIKICERNNVELPQKNESYLQVAERNELSGSNWQERTTVLKHRLGIPHKKKGNPMYDGSYEILFKLFGDKWSGNKEKMMEALRGFDLSIRPLNLSKAISSCEAINYVLPELGYTFQKDPFGVQRKEALVIKEKDGRKIYLATRKKDHGTYLAILTAAQYCTGGCARCYRGEQTRKRQKFTAIDENGKEEEIFFATTPTEQIEGLVEEWKNEKDPPSDILLSGGEPMNINPDQWEGICNALKKAENLRSFRICTGDLFLGEPFRLLEPKFIEAVTNFRKETGIAVKFATNLPHPAMITPEAIYAINKLQKLGIGIEFQSQTPLMDGVNCFQKEIVEKLEKVDKMSDEKLISILAPSLAKSVDLLEDLCVKFSDVSNRPYKFIHDMQKSVSLIYTTMVYSILCEPHVGVTDSSIRPTSFALFTPKLPNLNMSFHSLHLMAEKKGSYKVDKKSKMVKMKLPHAIGKTAEFEEPYIKGLNDKEVLEKITDEKFWSKLCEEVKRIRKKTRKEKESEK